MKQKLFDLLYEWTIEENCDYCKHLKSFRDGDNRHPCNRCEAYELFKLDDALKNELDDRVRQVISIVKKLNDYETKRQRIITERPLL